MIRGAMLQHMSRPLVRPLSHVSHSRDGNNTSKNDASSEWIDNLQKSIEKRLEYNIAKITVHNDLGKYILAEISTYKNNEELRNDRAGFHSEHVTIIGDAYESIKQLNVNECVAKIKGGDVSSRFDAVKKCNIISYIIYDIDIVDCEEGLISD